MKQLYLFAFMIFVSIMACKTIQKSQQQARTKIETAIPDMIKMIESEEYTELFNTYVNPKDLKQMTQKQPLNDLIKNFVENGKSEKLLNILKHAQTVKPIYNETKTSAVYKKETISTKKDLILIKQNGFWYIIN